MRFDIHVHHHGSPDLAVMALLETIMATLDDVLAEVTKETTAIGGVTALIAGLRQQIADALNTHTIPPAVQAKVDAIFAAATANNAAIAQALADPGTPKNEPVTEAPKVEPAPAPESTPV